MQSPAHPFVDQLLDFYSWVAPLYDGSAGGAHDRAADSIAELAAVAPQESVLDIGCGTGLVTHRLEGRLSFGGHTMGVDISLPMLEIARAARPSGSEAAFAVMDAHDLAIRDSTVDVVILAQVLGYLLDPVAALAETRRVLRSGGRVALSCQRRSLCTPAEEVFFRTLGEMAAGFRIPRLPQHHELFGEPWALQELLTQAGFTFVHTTQLVVPGRTRDAAAWVDLMMQSGPYPYAALSLLQPAGRAHFEHRVEAAMRELDEGAFRYQRAYTFALAQSP